MDTTLFTVTVSRKYIVADDTVCLELRAQDGHDLPAFEPGAHIDVHLPGGLIRQFSLLNSPADTSCYVIAVLREPDSRGGSIAVHDKVQADDNLQISQPRNHFGLVAASKSLLFAGGIGITPILCMMRHLQSSNADFELHYSCRNRKRAAFMDDISQLVQPQQASFHFDDEPDTRFDFAAVLDAVSDKKNTHIYACGPSGYIDAIRGQAWLSGFGPDNFHFEHFSLADDAKPVITEDDFAFQVQLASTGEIFDIPADESITDALDRQGVFIPVSCEEGICGTCLTGIVSGSPDHRDTYLTEIERSDNDQFTPCCSRSLSPLLVLDL